MWTFDPFALLNLFWSRVQETLSVLSDPFGWILSLLQIRL